MIVLYFVIKKNLEISFQNGPEHETKSLRDAELPVIIIVFVFLLYYLK